MKFEYKVESYSEDAGWSQPNDKGEVKWEKREAVGLVAQRKMNERGAEGWELVSMVFDGKSLTAFYKRCVPLMITIDPTLSKEQFERIRKQIQDMGRGSDWRAPVIMNTESQVEFESDPSVALPKDEITVEDLVESGPRCPPEPKPQPTTGCMCHVHPSTLPCGAEDCINRQL